MIQNFLLPKIYEVYYTYNNSTVLHEKKGNQRFFAISFYLKIPNWAISNFLSRIVPTSDMKTNTD